MTLADLTLALKPYFQMKRDQLLVERLSNLTDGKMPRPLVHMEDLVNSIIVGGAPLLLPPLPQYFSDNRSLSTDQVRDILHTNSFGSFDDANLALSGDVTKKGSKIYSALSLFNHSFTPNCALARSYGSSCAVLTLRNVNEGEELTISYHHDPEVLKRKWNIC